MPGLSVATVAAVLVAGLAPVPPTRPLTWRVGTVDERFGATPEEVREAVRAAEDAWEQATGEDLFGEAPDGRIVVELRYDERQRRLEDVRREAHRLDREARLLASRAEHTERRSQDLEEAIQAHNAEVEAWSNRRRVPAETRTRLDDQSTRLETLAAELAAEGTRTRERQVLLGARALSLARDQATGGWTAGVWHEDSGRVVIYTWDTPEDLAWEIAHELGHALGIQDHVAEEGALMAEVAPDIIPPWVTLRPADLAALEAVPPRPRLLRWIGATRRAWQTWRERMGEGERVS